MFRPFFIQLNLPYSVIRGEVVAIQAVIFNYMNKEVTAELTFENIGDFQFVDSNEVEDNEISRNINYYAVFYLVTAIITFCCFSLRRDDFPQEIGARSGSRWNVHFLPHPADHLGCHRSSHDGQSRHSRRRRHQETLGQGPLTISLFFSHNGFITKTINICYRLKERPSTGIKLTYWT